MDMLPVTGLQAFECPALQEALLCRFLPKFEDLLLGFQLRVSLRLLGAMAALGGRQRACPYNRSHRVMLQSIPTPLWVSLIP